MEQQPVKSVTWENYLKRTDILDFDATIIQSLIRERGWGNSEASEKVKHIYNFVKDEIAFGYNVSDSLSASAVLEDGYGQCNTKANLFMALLRAVGVPNRLHGFTIYKALQKGAINGIWYKLAPENILHSWVEVYVNEVWLNLEGIILDEPYLSALQRMFPDCKTTFCGYGAYTDTFQKPEVEWAMRDTYIQEKGINQDFGLFDTPDEFYSQHHQKLSLVKGWVYKYYVRHLMNKNVQRIRRRGRSIL
jgi:hypothetical protein